MLGNTALLTRGGESLPSYSEKHGGDTPIEAEKLLEEGHLGISQFFMSGSK